MIESLATGDVAYPARLRDLSQPPDPLWIEGVRSVLDLPCVAIVGTRTASPYGERTTAQLSRALARAGACVISGLARGIDAAAHRAALEVNGATCAVLGTGVEVVYPRGHAALQRQIASAGLLVSELAPANAAHGGSFPRRNRIIAALAHIVIVTEAGFKSGALITADHALELGRVVAAVPGPIDMPQAQGSNLLLRDGAVALTSIADALALAGLSAPVTSARLPEGSHERLIWEALLVGPAHVDVLSTRARLPAQQALAAVSTLEILGYVECGASGEVRRT